MQHQLTILLVDVFVGSFSSYIYQPTPWTKHTKTTVGEMPRVVNYIFLLLLSSSTPAGSGYVPSSQAFGAPPSWGDPSVAINFISGSACRPYIVSVHCYVWPTDLPSAVACAEQKHASRISMSTSTRTPPSAEASCQVFRAPFANARSSLP